MAGLDGLLVLGIAAVLESGPSAPPAGSLPVPPEAVDVIFRRTRDAPTVEYLVREDYPALRTIEFLTQAMSLGGWRLIEVEGFQPAPWEQPDMPIPPGPGVHTWSGRWRNQKGREAGFWLDYRCPMESSRMHSVWLRVRGGILSEADAARLERDRKIRQEEACRNARAMGLPQDRRCGK
jgi:hypothetical protein